MNALFAKGDGKDCGFNRSTQHSQGTEKSCSSLNTCHVMLKTLVLNAWEIRDAEA
jgi:hypothetical protein